MEDLVDRLFNVSANEWLEPLCVEAGHEIKKLRRALREIHVLGDTPDDSWKAYQICCKALGEKE